MNDRSSAPVVVDAGVLIAHLDVGDALHQRAGELLARLTGARLAASALTVAECLVRPAQRGKAPAVDRAIGRLGVERIPLRPQDAVALAMVRADTRLRLPDAVVVLTAEVLGAALATSDQAVARAAKARGIVVYEV